MGRSRSDPPQRCRVDASQPPARGCGSYGRLHVRCHRATPGGGDLAPRGRRGCVRRSGPGRGSGRTCGMRRSRSDRASLVFTAPHPEQVLEEGTSGRPRSSRPPFHGGLVGQLAADLGEAGVGDVPGQPPVAQHPGDVEVFDHDRAVLPGQPGGELVQSVAAQVRHPGVRPARARVGARCHRFEASRPMRRSGPDLAATARRRGARSWRCAAFRCRGLGTSSPVDSTARSLMPDVDADHASGRAGVRGGALDLDRRTTTCHRPPSRRTVADRIRAVPASTRRASLRADSCSFNRPSRGSTTCLRSGSTRIAPVVNRTDGVRAVPALEPREPDPAAGSLARRGNPTSSSTRGPGCPGRCCTPPWNSRAHHGATSALAVFHARRSAGSDHDDRRASAARPGCRRCVRRPADPPPP